MGFIFFICTLDADRGREFTLLHKPGKFFKDIPDTALAGYLFIYFGQTLKPFVL